MHNRSVLGTNGLMLSVITLVVAKRMTQWVAVR